MKQENVLPQRRSQMNDTTAHNTIPFPGVRYDAEKIGSIEAVVAPPYDVISPEQRVLLCSQHACNVANLTLGQEKQDDTDSENRYTRAGKLLSQWQREGALRQDDSPAYYVYDQEFGINGTTYTRRAFFAAVRLEPFGRRILPHEETMPGPRADRLRLIKACPANLSPIFGLYPDAGREIAALLDEGIGTPEVSFVDTTGIRQTLWRLDDPGINARISELMADKPIYIADGHHRYETALLYRDLADQAEGGLAPNDPRNFVMIASVALSDPGLVVLPAHRVIGGIEGFDVAAMLDRLAARFNIAAVDAAAPVPAMLEGMKGRKHTFGIYSGGKAWTISLKNEAMADENPVERSQAWKRLDVSVLVGLILDDTLGFTHEDLSDPRRVAYVKDDAAAAELVDSNQYQFACYLNPTGLHELETIAQGGERMPPKSTYFYPKLLTGLVMRKLR